VLFQNFNFVIKGWLDSFHLQKPSGVLVLNGFQKVRIYLLTHRNSKWFFSCF